MGPPCSVVLILRVKDQDDLERQSNSETTRFNGNLIVIVIIIISSSIVIIIISIISSSSITDS